LRLAVRHSGVFRGRCDRARRRPDLRGRGGDEELDGRHQAKYRHTITPLELAEQGAQSVVKARLAGSFPGSPITVNFNFVLAGGKIRALTIG
jgi:hypothetical protein